MESHSSDSKPAPSEKSPEISVQHDIDTGTKHGIQEETRQLKQNFGIFSLLGLAATLMATWEAICGVFVAGLVSGGPVALVYGYILSFTGTLLTCLSLSEMAAMYPTSGGQYHWVAHLAPKRHSRFLSYLSGWVTVLGWQAVTASLAIFCGNIIQALIFLNVSSYEPTRWKGTLLYWGIIALSVFMTTVMAKWFPLLERAVLVYHVGSFFVLLIVLGVMAPKTSPEFVFKTFINFTGWNNGVAWCIGQLSAAYVFLGYDGAAHMSEELADAARTLPKVMISSVVLNGVMGFAWLLMLLFCLGDVETALYTPTGFPVLEIFTQATGSIRGATALMSVVIVLIPIGAMGLMAAASRTTWAFARDQGLPFSTFFSHVSRSLHVPVRATILSGCLLFLLGLVNIGSTTAFSAILSLAVIGLYLSYLAPIILMIIARFGSEPIVFGSFCLGRFGLPINILASIYTIFICIFLLFPGTKEVTAQNMNYAGPLVGLVLFVSVGWWFIKGRKDFIGPLIVIEAITKEPSPTV